ncbi:MAG TPA: hypothetical protein VNO30_06090 [Kofleriaceae bacterium]|nr:hypothetical protein [Kofleriaceae bacterium]
MATHPSWRGPFHLRRELTELRSALDAARILAEAVATSQLGPERDHRQAPRALTSMLSLIGKRLRELHRAVAKTEASAEPPHAEPSPRVEPPPRPRAQPSSPRRCAQFTPDERLLLLVYARQQRARGARRP